jgi:hypothetical protein
VPADRVSDLDRQLIHHYESANDEKRAFTAFKEDKLQADLIKVMVEKKKAELARYPRSQKEKSKDVNLDDQVPIVKQSDYVSRVRDWNPQREPPVLIPKPFQSKLHSDRVDDRGSILEKMQKALDLH